MLDGCVQPFVNPAGTPHYPSVDGYANKRPIANSTDRYFAQFWRFSLWLWGCALDTQMPVDDGGDHDFVVGRAVPGEVRDPVGDFSGEDGDVHGRFD